MTQYKYVPEYLWYPAQEAVLAGPFDKVTTVTCDEVGTLAPNYEWFPSHKTWSRIETVDEISIYELKDIGAKWCPGSEEWLRQTEEIYCALKWG